MKKELNKASAFFGCERSNHIDAENAGCEETKVGAPTDLEQRRQRGSTDLWDVRWQATSAEDPAKERRSQLNVRKSHTQVRTTMDGSHVGLSAGGSGTSGHPFCSLCWSRLRGFRPNTACQEAFYQLVAAFLQEGLTCFFSLEA